MGQGALEGGFRLPLQDEAGRGPFRGWYLAAGGKVFVAGHSVGAVLTCLAAMMPSPYRAAAALDGYVDMETWAAHSPAAGRPRD